MGSKISRVKLCNKIKGNEKIMLKDFFSSLLMERRGNGCVKKTKDSKPSPYEG
jgi:hypothetical protein